METLVFLDTHVIVWLYAGELDLISLPAQKAIEQSKVLISPMSILEVDYLYETRKVKIRGRPVFDELHETIGLVLANDPLSDIASAASRLSWTRDPFDRLIVAHASCHKAPLITKDRSLRKHYHSIW